MKMQYVTLNVFLILSLVWSAQATILTGDLQNVQTIQGQLRLTLLSGHIPLITDSKVIHLDPNGHFHTEVNIKQGRFAYLDFNDQQILLYLPADGTLHISGSAIDLLATIQFARQARSENIFIQHHLQIDYDSLWQKVPPKMRSKARELMVWAEAQRKHSYAQLNQTRSKLSEDSYKKLQYEVVYYYTNFILYLDFVGKLQAPLSIRDSLINERIEAGYPFAFSPHASKFIELSLYTLEKRIKPDMAFFQKELHVSSDEEVVNTLQEPNIAEFIFYKNTLSDGFLERALANQLLYSTEHAIYEHLPRIHQYFKENFPNSQYRQQIDERMRPAYTVTVHKNEDIIFLPEDQTFTSLKAILDYLNLKEQLILVDIWGSWCKPCREEFKFIPTIKDQLKDRRIAYLYIADQKKLSKPVDKWKKAIAMHQLTGYHIMMNEQLDKELIINGYPTYKIVNREGKVLIEDAANPSDADQLIEQLTSFLNK